MKKNSLLLGLVLAQASPLFAAESKPTDAAAAVPAATYRSAFEGYRPATEEPIADWRALNEEVAAVGGHAGIMRGGAQQAPEAAAKPTQQKPHAGHPH
jgi:hypothetical protein